ncbi:MAG: flagellar hook-length control protein FliK, partial [Campylobacterota bacterium]|nr:flagellar hook-length control protein FliK [Campylobacterota bacterium]
MISLDVKTDTSSASPLNLSTPDEEPTLSFSQLLKGAKKDDKIVQNGSLVLSLGENEKETKTLVKSGAKNDALLSLLKNEDTQADVELNPKLSQSLTPKELKTLIADAKQYLKSKIENSDGYKKVNLEELPKTLKGLASFAKKLGVDISKISIEEVQSHKEQGTKTLDIKTTPIKEALNTEAPKEFKTTPIKEALNTEAPKEVKTTPIKEALNTETPKEVKTT